MKAIGFSLSLVFLASVGVSAQTLQLVRNEKLAEQVVAQKLLLTIYHRAGLDAVVDPLPAARANLMSTAGECDGEVARIASYAEANPTLLRVDPAYYSLTTVAFSKSENHLKITSLEDLAHYRVGVIRGVKHSADATAGLTDVTQVGSADQLFAMLDAGRFDVALDTGINGDYTVRKARLTHVTASAVLAKLDLFHYLTEKNRSVATKLAAVIKAMTASGELAKLVAQTEKEFLVSGVAP